MPPLQPERRQRARQELNCGHHLEHLEGPEAQSPLGRDGHQAIGTARQIQAGPAGTLELGFVVNALQLNLT